LGCGARHETLGCGGRHGTEEAVVKFEQKLSVPSIAEDIYIKR
jgi:hypothetical protein